MLALILYARATHPRNRAGTYVYWIGVVLLTLVWYNNLTGPPPPDAHSAPVFSFFLFSCAVAWTYWVDRLRAARDFNAQQGTA